MRFNSWFYNNVILKDPRLQYISRLSDDIRVRNVSAEMGRMKREEPYRYSRYRTIFDEEKKKAELDAKRMSASIEIQPIPDIPKDSPPMSMKDLEIERMEEYRKKHEKRHGRPNDSFEEPSIQLSLFDKPKISTLIRALKKVSNAR